MYPADITIYAGTYTEGTTSDGIYALRIRMDGTVEPMGCVATAHNPSFLIAHPKLPMFYAVEETYGVSGREGAIHAYSVYAGGNLKHMGKIGSAGIGPCFLSLDQRGENLFFANYHSGSIGGIGLTPEGGLTAIRSLIHLRGSSIHPIRQTKSHPHAIVPSLDGRYVVVADLGTDQLHVFSIDDASALSPSAISSCDVSAGSGPRHLVAHPHGKFLYVIHEISGTVSVHSLSERGIISSALQICSTSRACETGSVDAADLFVDEMGEVLYACTRGTSTLRLFCIDGATGMITFQNDFSSNGHLPHALGGDRHGKWLAAANLQSGTLALFERTMRNEPVLQETFHIPSVSSIVFTYDSDLHSNALHRV